jgi:hypothetical protein
VPWRRSGPRENRPARLPERQVFEAPAGTGRAGVENVPPGPENSAPVRAGPDATRRGNRAREANRSRLTLTTTDDHSCLDGWAEA